MDETWLDTEEMEIIDNQSPSSCTVKKHFYNESSAAGGRACDAVSFSSLSRRPLVVVDLDCELNRGDDVDTQGIRSAFGVQPFTTDPDDDINNLDDDDDDDADDDDVEILPHIDLRRPGTKPVVVNLDPLPPASPAIGRPLFRWQNRRRIQEATLEQVRQCQVLNHANQHRMSIREKLRPRVVETRPVAAAAAAVELAEQTPGSGANLGDAAASLFSSKINTTAIRADSKSCRSAISPPPQRETEGPAPARDKIDITSECMALLTTANKVVEFYDGHRERESPRGAEAARALAYLFKKPWENLRKVFNETIASGSEVEHEHLLIGIIQSAVHVLWWERAEVPEIRELIKGQYTSLLEITNSVSAFIEQQLNNVDVLSPKNSLLATLKLLGIRVTPEFSPMISNPARLPKWGTLVIETLELTKGKTRSRRLMEQQHIRLSPVGRREDPKTVHCIPPQLPHVLLQVQQHARITVEIYANEASDEEFWVEFMDSTRTRKGIATLRPGHQFSVCTRSAKVTVSFQTTNLTAAFNKEYFTSKPSVFRSDFSSIERLSVPLDERLEDYESVMQRIKKQKCATHPDIVRLLDMYGFLCNSHIRTCAFREVFWCHATPFYPIMFGDAVGFSWNPTDINVVPFIKAFRQLEDNLYNKKPKILNHVPSHQIKKLYLFVLENRYRMKELWETGSLSPSTMEDTVWDFDNIVVRAIQDDDPRQELRGQLGVFASAPIPQGKIIGPYVGNVYSDITDRKEKHPLLRTYCASRELYELDVKRELAVDAGRFGNRLIFVNDYRILPQAEFLDDEYRVNCEIKAINQDISPSGPQIHVFCATRDIDEGEEILVDYGVSYWSPKNNARTLPYKYGAIDTITFLDSIDADSREFLKDNYKQDDNDDDAQHSLSTS